MLNCFDLNGYSLGFHQNIDNRDSSAKGRKYKGRIYFHVQLSNCYETEYVGIAKPKTSAESPSFYETIINWSMQITNEICAFTVSFWTNTLKCVFFFLFRTTFIYWSSAFFRSRVDLTFWVCFTFHWQLLNTEEWESSRLRNCKSRVQSIQRNNANKIYLVLGFGLSKFDLSK